MKPGSAVHVGGGHLVTLCHAVAYIPSLSGVMWHTCEEGYVFLSFDVRGHLVALVVPDDVAFMRQYKDEFKMLELPLAPPTGSFFSVLLETVVKGKK